MSKGKQFLSQHSGWRVNICVNPTGLSSRDSQASPSPTVSPTTSPVCNPDSLLQLWLLPHTINSTDPDPVPSLTTLGPHVPLTAQKAYLCPHHPPCPWTQAHAHFMVSSDFSYKIQIKDNIIMNFKKTIAKH